MEHNIKDGKDMKSGYIRSAYSKILFMHMAILSLIATYSYNNFDSKLYELVPTSLTAFILKAEAILSKDSENKDLVVEVTPGDNLMSILKANAISNAEADQIIKEIQKVYDLKTMYAGQEIVLSFIDTIDDISDSKNNILQSINVKTSPYKYIKVERISSGDFHATLNDISLVKNIVKVSGEIEGSLFYTTTKLGIPDKAVIEMVKGFSYDIDFQRDIKQGDRINVIFERYYTEEGEFSHDGKVIFASLHLSNEEYSIYGYTDSNGETSFYGSDGKSVQKDLLKTPINAARISSGFGIRHHPVLGFSKMHKGVDFAAPIGTPILAAGDGIIEDMGRKGSYGNYVRIKHNGNFATAYAHASRFAKGLKKGTRVKQGQIIAFVGTTGRSTGPHLHYELIENGKQINPLKLKLTSSKILSKIDLIQFAAFKKEIEKINFRMASGEETTFKISSASK